MEDKCNREQIIEDSHIEIIKPSVMFLDRNRGQLHNLSNLRKHIQLLQMEYVHYTLAKLVPLGIFNLDAGQFTITWIGEIRIYVSFTNH